MKSTFRKLQGGVHGVPPGLVRADQDARLMAAMIQVVGRKGYAATTVADVIARAGVSRRTFYEHHADKQDCFLAAYDAIIRAWSVRAMAVHQAAPGWRDSLRAGMGAVFEQVIADPLGAETVFVAALGAGVAALERRSRAIAGFESMVRSSFDAAPGGARLRPALVTVIVGGVRTVIENRLRDGRLDELPSLVEPLTAWLLGYRSGVATDILDNAGANMAPTRTRVSRAPIAPSAAPLPLQLWQDAGARPVVVRTPRERILDAVTRIVADDGYHNLSVAEIGRVARTSRQTFNSLFASKEDAFLAAYDAGAKQTVDRSTEAFLAGPSWPAAVHMGLAAHNRFLAAHEELARIGFLEVYSAGPAAVRRLDDAMQFFRAGLEQADQHIRRAKPLPVISEAIGGGIFELMRGVVLHRGAAALPSILDDTVYAALAPYIGAKAAALEATRADRRVSRS